MFNEKDAKRLLTPSIETQAFLILIRDGISDLRYTDSYPLINIKADVSDGFHTRYVTLQLDEAAKKVTQSRCSCYEGNNPRHLCVHKAAILMFWGKIRGEGSLSLSSEEEQEPSSSYAVERFLEKQPAVFRSADRSGTVFLQAYCSSIEEDSNALCVEFKIGREGSNGYVLKDIGKLVTSDDVGESIRYGKNLDFVPSDESFQYRYRPMYRFLRQLVRSDDLFTARSDYAYYNSYYYRLANRIDRYLTLKGRYLDEFFEVLGDQPLFMNVRQGRQEVSVPLRMSEEPYRPPVVLEKMNEGIVLKNSPISFVTGTSVIYLFNIEGRTIHRIPVEQDSVLVDVLKLLQENDRYFYINSGDMARFLETVYPVLRTSFEPQVTGFDPMRYLPPEPTFAFYLDLPQDDMITCEAYACYDKTRYNLYDGQNNGKGRNLREEKAMENSIGHWFNSFDTAGKKMVIIDDDSRMVSFLVNGIPALQAAGEVYVSDRLKRLQVRSMPKVSVGVSLSNNLLQLNIEGEQRSLEDLAEILSRYSPKKKYYRLKNGSFIQVDNEEALAEMARLSEDLQLSAKEIRSGEASVPAYRAMYIEKAAQEADHMDINRDSYFRTLIEEMEDPNKTYEVPPSLKDILREYQKNGYWWLRRLYDNHFAGLLADEMGLGKTLQVIAFLLSLEDRGQSLVVCPASLVYNWQSEIRRFAPEIPTAVISGSPIQRKTQIETAADNAVLITSYDALKRDTDVYEGRSFEVEVLDEAQYIKNASTMAAESAKAINARFRIALTGTPIENRLSELWSIFDYLMPGFLFRYNYFRTHYEKPIVQYQDKDTQESLRKMIAPFVLRRRKTEVLTELPEKLEEVYYAPLEGEQRELYEARSQRLKLMLGKESDAEFRKNRIAVLAEITRLRQTCCAPSLIYENYKGNSAKEDMCMELIRTAVDSGHKILLFSQFKTMLETLNARLEKEGIACHFLSGETPKEERAKMVDSFQNDEVPVFSISLKAGGTGLNLTAADIVIHYDPWWNTAVENQASDRTHRIGQTKVVTVYRLIVQDTIEERILKLQERKADLAGEILSGEELSSSSLTREQLMEIL